MNYIILFKGIRELMKADRLCKREGLSVNAIPIPHKYTTECGMSLVIDECNISKFKEIATGNDIEFQIEEYED